MHIVLLGDSIFDNRAYTGPEPDVASHLRTLLPNERTTLLAVDGSTISDLSRQLARVPEDASHLVISIGGNDALMNSDLLDLPARSTAEALEMFAQRIADFESGYRGAVAQALRFGLPTTICTIYNGNLPDPRHARLARVALTTFNDVILRVGFEHGLDVIDLRIVCNEPGDYANPIEPSGPGGLKIARAIAMAVGALAAPSRRSEVWTG
jgi:lysophospholipase L1-like esterase